MKRLRAVFSHLMLIFLTERP